MRKTKFEAAETQWLTKFLKPTKWWLNNDSLYEATHFGFPNKEVEQEFVYLASDTAAE